MNIKSTKNKWTLLSKENWLVREKDKNRKYLSKLLIKDIIIRKFAKSLIIYEFTNKNFLRYIY